MENRTKGLKQTQRKSRFFGKASVMRTTVAALLSPDVGIHHHEDRHRRICRAATFLTVK
jgi:hypothetical protein